MAMTSCSVVGVIQTVRGQLQQFHLGCMSGASVLFQVASPRGWLGLPHSLSVSG